MSKTLVIYGATGQQGGSVAHYVLDDPTLSKDYKVRAVTRDVSKPAAQALKSKGAEVVSGDIEDPASIKQTIAGAHTVVAVTVSGYEDGDKEKEISIGKTLADSAVAAGAQYFIFSSITHVTRASGGKYKNVDFFDSKYEVEEYVRTLPIKSAFFHPGSFMQNFVTQMAPRPSPAGDGTFAMANCVSPDTQFPLIEVAEDSGKFIGAILAEPDKYEGKVFSAATKIYTLKEIAEVASKVTGKTIVYNQLPVEVFQKFLPPHGYKVIEMVSFLQDFGYYGENTKEKVEWTAKQARGKLTTLEEFFTKNLKL